LIEGLKYLKSIGYVHRELRPENILVTSNEDGILEPYLSHHLGVMKAVVGNEVAEDDGTVSISAL
jgi:serine/threonine protein kinase